MNHQPAWQDSSRLGGVIMKEIKKIVCAVDLAEFSADVAEYAVMVARGMNAELIVLYVAPSLTQYSAFEIQPKALESVIGEITEEAGRTMQEVMDEYFDDVNAEGRVVIGYPADEIIKTAEKEDADLIIMGTHGRQGMDLIIFGSVADKVVKNADMPVLTIRPVKDEEAE